MPHQPKMRLLSYKKHLKMAKKKKFSIPRSIESKYNTLLSKLMRPVIKEAQKYAGNITKFRQVLKNTSKSKTFKKKSEEIARTIATMTYQTNERNWRAAAAKGSRGREIRTALEKEIEGNVKKRMEELFKYNATLIQTLPINVSEKVIEHINTESFAGRRAEELEEEIRRYFPKASKASAKLIARTETSKFSSALTQARAEELRLWWYVWRTSEDVAVRSSHRIMDGVLIHYNHPPVPERLDTRTKYKKYPAPYHAGNIYNCRCYQEPLTDYDDVKWPHKLYDWKTNKIITVSLEKFRNEFN